MENIALLLWILPLSLISLRVYRSLTDPLNSFPGPTLAKFTDLWRFFDVWAGRADLTQQALHKKHGRYVRLGPNCLSITDPAAIKSVYTTRNAFPKSEFYAAGDIVHKGKRITSQFSARDEAWHTATMRPIVKLFSMNNVLHYEPLIDQTISSLLRKLNEEFVGKKACDMDNWLHYYAWDVIGQVTFSKPLGFIEKGGDVNGLLNAGRKGFDYLSIIGQIPSLDNLLDKNPFFRIGPPAFDGLIGFAAQQLFGRLSGTIAKSDDMLDRFIQTRDTDPDVVDQDRLFSYTMINVAAGSDTTAITLRSVLYYILRHPNSHGRLRKEISSSSLQVPVSWNATQSLPYLDAVIRESMRLHPAVGLPLERVVDKRGLELPNGLSLPPGTIVGINPSTIHRDPEMFGIDADEFRPERWLRQADEDERTYEDRRNAMDQATFTFGYGSRACIGRHIAFLEVYKVIASLFASYEMQLANPEREWKVRDSFFNRQWDIPVNMELLH